jgi:hypothetical protein
LKWCAEEEMSEREQLNFFNLGTQYYIAARYSAFAGFLPVSGNLFHHAIEMFLKGHLTSKKGSRELRRLGHQLPELWKYFKLDISDETLNRYDNIIAELDKFESIRYPDNIVKDGMAASITIKRQQFSIDAVTPELSVPIYTIVVEEIDGLVEAIFQKSSVNPKFFTNRLKTEAREYLQRENETSLT